MAITVGALTTGTDGSAETAAPSDTGGTLILQIRTRSAVNVNTPTGWTQRAHVADAFSGSRLAVYTRPSDGGADDTPTLTFSATPTNWATRIIRDTGLDATPFDDCDTGSNTSSSSIAVPTSAASVANTRSYVFLSSSAADVSSDPTGYTQLWDETGGAFSAWYKDNGASGNYGGESVGMSFAHHNSVAHLILKTAGGVAPTITSDGGGPAAQIDHPEGSATVTTVVASGTPTPTYSITGGTDSADFGIGSSTGVLTFAVTPDYDAPHDSDGDSVYVVEVTATNSEGTDAQTLTVVVYPVYSGPAPDAPLDDADYLFRPLADHLAGNTQYPNHGTRDEPLVLGDSHAADAHDPDWVSDGTLGNHLLYVRTSGSESWSSAACPAAVLDADFTVAVRFRLNATGADQNLFNVMDDDEVAKTIFMHCSSGNVLVGRVWDGTTLAQVPATGATALGTGATHTAALTWTGADKTLRLYLDGAPEASAVAANARLTRGTAGRLHWALNDSALPLGAKWFRSAFWDRAISGAEVLALETNAQWTTDGEGAGGLSIPVAMYHYKRLGV